MRTKNVTILLLAACLLLFAGPAPAGQKTSGLSLEPDGVKISAFFDGATVRVRGQVPAGDQVAVRLSSPPKEAAFRVKDRRWGILWMNQGEVSFHGVPAVYMLQGSSNSAEDFNLGLKHLRAHTSIEGGKGDQDKLFKEFLKIKTSEGLYNISAGGVHLGQAKDGLQTFECSFKLSPRVPQGSYRVQSFLKGPDGRVTAGASRELTVAEVGFPALLSFLAFHYGLVYGILAALVALVGGLLTSLLFKGGGGAH